MRAARQAALKRHLYMPCASISHAHTSLSLEPTRRKWITAPSSHVDVIDSKQQWIRGLGVEWRGERRLEGVPHTLFASSSSRAIQSFWHAHPALPVQFSHSGHGHCLHQYHLHCVVPVPEPDACLQAAAVRATLVAAGRQRRRLCLSSTANCRLDRSTVCPEMGCPDAAPAGASAARCRRHRRCCGGRALGQGSRLSQQRPLCRLQLPSLALCVAGRSSCSSQMVRWAVVSARAASRHRAAPLPYAACTHQHPPGLTPLFTLDTSSWGVKASITTWQRAQGGGGRGGVCGGGGARVEGRGSPEGAGGAARQRAQWESLHGVQGREGEVHGTNSGQATTQQLRYFLMLPWSAAQAHC